MKCFRCGSYAINDHLHERVKGERLDLCDVCYWRNKYEVLLSEKQKLLNEIDLLHKDGMSIYGMIENGRAKAAAKRCAEIANEHNSIEGIAERIEAAIKKEFKL